MDRVFIKLIILIYLLLLSISSYGQIYVYGGKNKLVLEIKKGFVYQEKKIVGRIIDKSIYENTVKDILSIGNQTGEGWFLTAEMIEYIEHGIPNIICVQPFACLPNHVVGKGVIKTIREKYPNANISPVDYDPGASESNQTNRIKLLMTVAKDNLKFKQNEIKNIEKENILENNIKENIKI